VAQVGSPDAPLFNASVQAAIRVQAPKTLDAYECVLLTYWFYETFESERLRHARTCLENAVVTDPGYSLGWSRLTFVYLDTRKYSVDTPANWAELSRAAATRAIEFDPDNANACYALAILTQMTSHDPAEFTNFAEKPVSLNPNDTFVLADLGTWMGYVGRWERGEEWVARSMLLNPRHQSWMHQIRHLDYYPQGKYRESRDLVG
jgi:adenylate cyclase